MQNQNAQMNILNFAFTCDPYDIFNMLLKAEECTTK